jgi:hypothetical protein
MTALIHLTEAASRSLGGSQEGQFVAPHLLTACHALRISAGENPPREPVDLFDLAFVLAALAFNLLIAGIFIADKLQRPKAIRALGLIWLSLALPLAAVFTRYLAAGRDPWILVGLGLVLLFMAVEWLLDYVLKIPFRRKLYLHVPYILLEYLALFSLIGIAFTIDRLWGWAVSVTFWIVMASLIYLYAGRKKASPA